MESFLQETMRKLRLGKRRSPAAKVTTVANPTPSARSVPVGKA
jgi:hypothetical protein